MTGNPPADGGPKRSGRLTDGNSTNQNQIVPSREGTPLQANQNPYFPSHDGFPPVKDGQQPTGELVDKFRTRFPDSDPNDGVHQEWVPEDKQVEWVKDDPSTVVQRHLAEQRPQGGHSPGPYGPGHGPQLPDQHPVDWSKVNFPGPDGYSGGHNVWNPVTKQVDWVRDPITKAPPTEQIPVPGEHPSPQPHDPWLGPGPEMPSKPVDWSKVPIPDSNPNDGIHQQWVPEHGRVEWVKDKPPGEVKTRQPDHDQNPGNGDTQHPVSHQPPPGDSHQPNGGVDQVVHQPPQVLTPDEHGGLAWVADHGQWKLKWLGDPKKAPLLDNGPYELRVGKDGELQSVYNARDKNQPVRDFNSDHHGGHGDDKSGLMVGPDGKVHWVGPSDKAPFVDNGKIHIGKDGAIDFDGADAKTGGLSRTDANGKVLNTDPSAGKPPEGFHGQHRYGMLPDEQDTEIALRHDQGKLLGKQDPPATDGGGSGKPHEGDPHLPPGKSQKPHVKSERPGDGGDKKDGGGEKRPFDPATSTVPYRPPADGKDGGKDGKDGAKNDGKNDGKDGGKGGGGDKKDGGGGEKRPLDPTTATVFRKPADGKGGAKNDGKDGGKDGGGGPKDKTFTFTSPGGGGGDKKDGAGDKKDGAGDKKDGGGDKKDGDGKDKKPKPLPAVKGPGGSGNLRFNKDDWNKLMSAFHALNLSLVDDATTTKEDGILGKDLKLQPESQWEPAKQLNELSTAFGGAVVDANKQVHERTDKFVNAMSWATEVFEKTDDLANYSLNEFVTEFPDLNAGGGKMTGNKGA